MMLGFVILYLFFYPEDSNKMKKTPRTDEPFPEDPDEFFFYEKLYCVHEEEIKSK